MIKGLPTLWKSIACAACIAGSVSCTPTDRDANLNSYLEKIVSASPEEMQTARIGSSGKLSYTKGIQTETDPMLGTMVKGGNGVFVAVYDNKTNVGYLEGPKKGVTFVQEDHMLTQSDSYGERIYQEKDGNLTRDGKPLSQKEEEKARRLYEILTQIRKKYD